MKKNRIIERVKSQVKYFAVFAFAVCGLASCDNDDLGGALGSDTRLEGKDKVMIIHDNPNTGAPYTDDELAVLGYDPVVQDSFPSSYRAEVLIWTQQKPLKVEIFKDGTDILVTQFETSTRDDRPELSDYKEGYGYSTKWKFKTGESDIPVGSSQTYSIKITYHDAGIDGFPSSSTRDLTFTVHHTEDKVVGSLSDFLVGYWRFNDPANLLKATVGNDLVLGGAASHSAVVGVNNNDGAAHLDVGTWYNVLDHNISDSFTMVWDLKVASADLGKYICLFQNNSANDTDGALYIHPNAGFWFNGGPGGHAEGTIKADTWHRVAVSYEGGDVIFYVDGAEIYSGSLSWPVDPTKFIILGENSSNDGNGEDNPISISEFMVFNSAFSATDLAGIPPLGEPAVETIASALKGRWKFDDETDLLKATLGNDLALGGAASHSAVAGVNDNDGAAHLDVGTWYDVLNHGVGADAYTMIWDIRVNEGDLGKYIPLLQNNVSNDSDASLYIHPDGGFWLNGGGTPGEDIFTADTWHRVVLSYNSGEVLLYVDGNEVVSESVTWPLDEAKFILFGEDSSNNGNGEDNPISVSDFLLFDMAFNVDQIEALPLINKSAL